MGNLHVTKLYIDLNAVSFNLNHFKSIVKKGTKIVAVIKAYGYGSDSIAIAKHIQNDVDYFAVAYSDEGIALRKEGIETSIIILHPQTINFDTIIEHCFEPNLYSQRTLREFSTTCKSKGIENYPVHLKFNTGLNRLGFSFNETKALAEDLALNKNIKVSSLFSHLAASEDKDEREFTLNQVYLFKKIKDVFLNHYKQNIDLHMTNTSGIINFPEAHFNMVRLGIGLYGFANEATETSKLKNVVQLKSIISQIHEIKKGESVGYNRALIADKKMKTATIPVGHADGIDRRFGNGKGYVLINNQKAYVVGNVCMDMLMVDITNINCNEGDTVSIFENQANIEDLALRTNTISYELITGISQRINRILLS